MEYLSVFSPNAGKYGPEKIQYLDTFHAVDGWSVPTDNKGQPLVYSRFSQAVGNNIRVSLHSLLNAAVIVTFWYFNNNIFYEITRLAFEKVNAYSIQVSILHTWVLFVMPFLRRRQKGILIWKCLLEIDYMFVTVRSQSAITFSKLTIERLEQGVKHVQS